MKEVTGRSRNHQPENQTHAYDYHWLYNPNDGAEPRASTLRAPSRTNRAS